MSCAVAGVIGDVPVAGVVVTNTPGTMPAGIEVVEGGHPLPDTGSVLGGRRLLELAAAAGGDCLVVNLISGGGSATAEVAAEGLTLDHIATVNDAPIRSGVPSPRSTLFESISQPQGRAIGAGGSTA
jgi:glycerate-2-kinase